MKNNRPFELELMRLQDIAEAVDLVSACMNRDEGQWSKETFDFYFTCLQYGMDCGRKYYVYKQDSRIVGLVGLHHYVWGPSENVWLSWFAVSVDRQGNGIGTLMLEAIQHQAKQQGYKKLFIETYDGPTFERARTFYQSRGFNEAGQIYDYLPGKEAMRVFKKDLE